MTSMTSLRKRLGGIGVAQFAGALEVFPSNLEGFLK